MRCGIRASGIGSSALLQNLEWGWDRSWQQMDATSRSEIGGRKKNPSRDDVANCSERITMQDWEKANPVLGESSSDNPRWFGVPGF